MKFVDDWLRTIDQNWTAIGSTGWPGHAPDRCQGARPDQAHNSNIGGIMWTITLEEHYATPAFLKGPGRELEEKAKTAGEFAAGLVEDLLDLCPSRIAKMDAGCLPDGPWCRAIGSRRSRRACPRCQRLCRRRSAPASQSFCWLRGSSYPRSRHGCQRT